MINYLKKNKAVVGYVILAVGTAIGVGGAAVNSASIEAALHSAQHRDEVLRGVVCRNITRADEQTLVNAKSSIVRELHLSNHFIREEVHKQLVISAQERKDLAPGLPPGTCSSKLTVLHLKTVKQRKAKVVVHRPRAGRPAPAIAPVSPVAVTPIFKRHTAHTPRRVPSATTPTVAPVAPPTVSAPPTNRGGHTPHGKARGLSK